MIFEQISIGGDRNFSYLIGDETTNLCCVIDPSFWPEKVLQTAQHNRLVVKYVINTHNHPDHNNGNEYFLRETSAVLVGANVCGIRTKQVNDGDILELGDLKINIIATPGHTTDSICILVENKLMTGDTLFVGKIGGTWSEQDARTQFESLHELMGLDNTIEVYPGHNYGTQPHTTIGNEKRTNPFLLCRTFDDFLNLKLNWAQYKLEHNIP